MIAKVRIAPLEHWCEGALAGQDIENCKRIVGQLLEIETTSLTGSYWCQGKAWNATDYIEKLREQIGSSNIGDPGRLACEHMLEMD